MDRPTLFNLIVRVQIYAEDDKEKLRKEGQTVPIGTAYPVAPERILTSRHVLAKKDQDIDPRLIDLAWYRVRRCPTSGQFIVCKDETGECFRPERKAISVVWDGGEEWDAVLLQCPFPKGITVPPDLLSGVLPEFHKNWSSEGFPKAGVGKGQPHTLKGETFGCAFSARSFQLQASTYPDEAEGWEGVSGAPIFVNERIIGLIQDVPVKFEARELQAIPMFRLLAIPEFRKAVGLPEQEETARINPAPFKSKIIALLENAPDVLEILENQCAKENVRDDSSSAPCKENSFKGRATHVTEKMFSSLESGVSLLRLAFHACGGADGKDRKNVLKDIACFFFPACFTPEASADLLTVHELRNEALLDARAASVPGVEFRMAAIEGRQAQFDEDRTGGPVGRKKIHDPPPFTPEKMRDEQVLEKIARFFYDKTTSEVQRPIKEYRKHNKAINSQFKLGKDPYGAPYLILGEPPDESENKRDIKETGGEKAADTRQLSIDELKSVAEELKLEQNYPDLVITFISDDPDVTYDDIEYLDWLWKHYEKASDGGKQN